MFRCCKSIQLFPVHRNCRIGNKRINEYLAWSQSIISLHCPVYGSKLTLGDHCFFIANLYWLGLTPSSSKSLNSTGLGITKSRIVLRSLSESSKEEDDTSEPDSLLDMLCGFDVGFTATRRVTGGPHPSGLREDYNLKLLNYSGLAPADWIVIWLYKSQWTSRDNVATKKNVRTHVRRLRSSVTVALRGKKSPKSVF